jgi:hypothetical protein
MTLDPQAHRDKHRGMEDLPNLREWMPRTSL